MEIIRARGLAISFTIIRGPPLAKTPGILLLNGKNPIDIKRNCVHTIAFEGDKDHCLCAWP
jgi:hypothetical protein